MDTSFPMKWTRLIGWFAGSACCLALAQEEVPPAFVKASEPQEQVAELDSFDPSMNAPKMVRVQVEMIDLPHATVTRLLMEEAAKAQTMDATALRKTVQALVDKSEAKLLDTQVVLSRSGQKSTVESIQEVIYPTEYEPPVTPTDKVSETQTIPALPYNPATPTAFETRNIGTTLEVEPAIAEDGKIIDLRFVPELTWHNGKRVWHEGKDSAGNGFQISMPDFYTIRLNTNVSCVDGQYVLAGVLSPKNDKGEVDAGRKVMAFVKCDILLSIP